MDRTTLLLSLCLGGMLVMLALLLLTADLLRHAWRREARLQRSLYHAQGVVSDYVMICPKCAGHATVAMAGYTMKCPACYNGREFLHLSADL